MILLLIIAVWALLVALFYAICVAAGRADDEMERMEAVRRLAEREVADLNRIPVLPYDPESLR